MLAAREGIDVGELSCKKRYPGCDTTKAVHELTAEATRGNPWLLRNSVINWIAWANRTPDPKTQFAHLMEDWQESLRRLVVRHICRAGQGGTSFRSPSRNCARKSGTRSLRCALAPLDRTSMRQLLNQAPWSGRLAERASPLKS